LLAAIASFRLGEPDGVSVEAAKWAKSLSRLGWTVRTIAGQGCADVLVPGLGINESEPPDPLRVQQALDGADVVIVENMLSLPLNAKAADILVDVLSGRPAVLHHYDLPWQHPGMAHPAVWPPDDRCWQHVTINERSKRELTERAILADTIPLTLPDPLQAGNRSRVRRMLRITPDRWLVLQPTRAIARKNVPAGLALAEQLNATYWLTGPAEDGYRPMLDELLRAARCPVIRGLPPRLSMADAYAAADVIAFPSTWEGFGLPLLEAAVYRRPLVIGDYPILRELHGLGFHWFTVDQLEQLRAFLLRPDQALLDVNERIARRCFSTDVLDQALATLLAKMELEARLPTATSEMLARNNSLR
jgi:glycosyltransferase involved in cell wall biosynthesis